MTIIDRQGTKCSVGWETQPSPARCTKYTLLRICTTGMRSTLLSRETMTASPSFYDLSAWPSISVWAFRIQRLPYWLQTASKAMVAGGSRPARQVRDKWLTFDLLACLYSWEGCRYHCGRPTVRGQSGAESYSWRI